MSTARTEFMAGVALRGLALSDLCSILDDAKIRWAGLKGIDLCHRAYPSPLARPMSDIDLLVDPRSLRAAAEALIAAGIPEDASDATHHRRFQWRLGAAPPIEIEIHRDLFDEPHGLPIDPAALLDRATSIALPDGSTLPVLDPSDAWIHVAGHFAYSDAGGVFVERAVADLEGLGRACALDAGELHARAAEWRLVRPIALVLSAVESARGRLTDPILRHFADLAPRFRDPRAAAARWLLRRRIERALAGLPAREPAVAMRALLAPGSIAGAKMLARAASR